MNCYMKNKFTFAGQKENPLTFPHTISSVFGTQVRTI